MKEIKNLKGGERLHISDLQGGDQIAMAVAKSANGSRGSGGFDMNDQRWHGSGGGGGTPGGSDTEIQFNDNGSFGGSSNLTFDKTPGGVLVLSAPNSATDGGQVFISSGSAQTDGFGGDLSLQTGDGTGIGHGAGVLYLKGGQGQFAIGGDIVLIPGQGVPNGSISIEDATTSINAVLDTSLLSTVDKNFKFPDQDGTFALAGLSGTKVYYVSDSSGGAVTRKLTFQDGILISES